MKFATWLAKQAHGTRARVIREVGSERAVRRAQCGEPIATYQLAEKLSKATGGVVTVASLCKPRKGEKAGPI
jgi:hypothetical protein